MILKNLPLLLCVLVISLVQAQNESSFKIHSITENTGIYQLEKLPNKSGIAGGADILGGINGHLIGINFVLGIGPLNENEVLKNSLHTFFEINALYGRELKLIRNVRLDIFTGIGYIVQTRLTNETRKAGLGFPIRARIIYTFNDHFGAGFNSSVNLNTKNDIYIYGLSFQFKF